MALLYVQGVVMKVGDLVKTCYNPDIGIVVEQLWDTCLITVVWSNGRVGKHNYSSLEVLCK